MNANAHAWRGLIEEYRDRLPVTDATPVVTLRRAARRWCPRSCSPSCTGCEVHLKVEGANPTGSFKDRGMTMAITKAAEEGAKAVICASTGNTSASAAAYAVRAGMVCAVLVPQGKIALGKMGQALVHGARILQVDGNFDDCLALAREARGRLPGGAGQLGQPGSGSRARRPPRSRSWTRSATPPTSTACRSGNAGNITAYWKGYKEYAADGVASRTPRMWGFQACGAAPIVRGEAVKDAADHRHRDPDRQPRLLGSGRRRAGRVRRRHRRGDRPSDPGAPTGCWPAKRASSSSPPRPRASPAC